jgi:hypothetical protein
MRHSALITLVAALCSSAAFVGHPLAHGSTDTSVQAVPKDCVGANSAESPAPQGHVDLSGSGLQFDPLAPGGARPADPTDAQAQAVDPTTVLLFPSTPSTTINEEKHHAKADGCP